MERTQDVIRKQIILAGALGDAFGYQVEFDSWNTIKARFGDEGIQKLQIEANSMVPASDDTQMTLFALQALIYSLQNNDLTVESICKRTRWAYQEWYETQAASNTFKPRKPNIPDSLFQEDTVMFQRQAPGNTCLSALSEGGFGSTTNPINGSKGCGAVMRAAPFAFLYPLLSIDDIWEITAEQGALTHGHVDGWAPGAALAVIIARMLGGESLHEASNKAMSRLAGVQADKSNLLLHKAITLGRMPTRLDPEELYRELGEGWTGDEALAIAVYSALQGTSVIDAIRIAANHRGDSDSTASIAGQLSAVMHPLSIDETIEVSFVDLFYVSSRTIAQFNEALNIFSSKS